MEDPGRHLVAKEGSDECSPVLLNAHLFFSLFVFSTCMVQAPTPGPGADPDGRLRPQSLARVGEPVPDHEFSRIAGHDGRTRLSQLRGHPVLIVGWRQWIPEPSGLHGAWFAHALLDRYADDGLIVILEDRNRWTRTRWWGARSFWIRSFGSPVWFAAGEPERVPDLPIVRESSKRDDRSLVLLGVDGTLLLEGTVEPASRKERSGDVRRRVRGLVKREIERRKKGWGEDRNLMKARALAYAPKKWPRLLQPFVDRIKRKKASCTTTVGCSVTERRSAVDICRRARSRSKS